MIILPSCIFQEYKLKKTFTENEIISSTFLFFFINLGPFFKRRWRMCGWLNCSLTLCPYVCPPTLGLRRWTYGSLNYKLYKIKFISKPAFSLINISFKLKEDEIKDKNYQRICNRDNIFYNHFCLTLWQIVYFKICTRT